MSFRSLLSLLLASLLGVANLVTSSSAQESPGAPAELSVIDLRGRTVTLAWRPPIDGAPPSGYVIEAGIRSGETLVRLTTLSDAPVFTVEAPPGTFFVRVHALAGSMAGPASNEIQVFVDVPMPPSAPVSLAGLVDGTNVVLSWTNTFAGGAPTSLWLEVSGASTAMLPLPMGIRFTAAGVPPGTYTLRVVAANPSGSSPPSVPVTLTVPGQCSGPPGAPTAFLATRAGDTVSLSWRPPAEGPGASSYVVRVSGAYTGVFETSALSFSGTVGPGGYAVSLVARNACGEGPAAPAAPDATAVVQQGSTHVVQWTPAAGARGYRVAWSASRDDLLNPGAAVSFADVSGSPWARPVGDANLPVFYRVFPLHGPVAGTGGPIAMALTFDVLEYPDWPGRLTPALWDVNGDGCLDMVGAWGRCDGSFQLYPLASAGLEGLAAEGRMNRDSRFADFTGDGVVDIFTNVYSRADGPPDHVAILHVGDGLGGFTADPGVASMQIRGFGETVLAADFDNDGDVDIFIPHYTHVGDGGRNWLLVNDGAGRFIDRAEAAGVAANLHFPPEGAQAIDVNQDGWVDIHVASHLFINNGDLTFTDRAAEWNLPILFDEGMRLFDVDLDGDFDLVHHDSYVTRLFTNQRGRLDAGREIDGMPPGSTFGYGLNICDVNGDGFEDVIVANNSAEAAVGQPRLLVNVGGSLQRSEAAPTPVPVMNDLLACADVDRSGLPDVISRWTEAPDVVPDEPTPRLVRYRTYLTRGGSGPTIGLRIVGESGQRNQQGRIVRVRPLSGPQRTMTRVVESGSAYMAQNGYDLLVAAPWPGDYEVAVRFAGGWVRTTARAGRQLTIHADGTVVPGLR